MVRREGRAAGPTATRRRSRCRARRYDADGRVLEYSELITRADTRVQYRYAYQPAAASS
jgi:hypothetical protein